METTNLSDTWSRRALQATEKPKAAASPAPVRSGNGSLRPMIGNAASPTLLEDVKLTREEIASLTQKGLIRAGTNGAQPLDKAVLQLVRLHNPVAGWTVLVGLVEVGPELAHRWLKNNSRNRPISDDVVDAYARDALQKQWVTTHQGVAFNDADELIDGQHRLMAVIRSGVACVLMASFGWLAKVPGKEMTTMDAVDRGRPRSVSDQLRIQHGFKDTAVTAAICAGIANLCCTERCRKLSVGNTLEVFREFEPAVLWVVKNRSKLKGLRSAGVLAAFAFVITAVGAVAERWFIALNTGENLGPRSPVKKIREFLTSGEQVLFNPGLNRGLAELVCQALFLEAEGKPMGDLALKEEGMNHFRGLQAERVARVARMFALPGKAA